ncbi:MAG: DUF3422 domain-containing protein [Desulfuromonadales bacterium]
MSEFFCLPFSTHPLRDNLYDELHARPFQVIGSPHQITHLAFKAQPAELDEAFRLLCDLCRRYDAAIPAAETVSYQRDFGEFTVRWEKHLEFYALTFKRPQGTKEPFRHRVLDLAPGDWLAQLPGQAVAAFHMVIDDGEVATDSDSLMPFFEGQRLILSEPKEGKVFLATAFKLHSDGFGRFFLQNRGISDYQMGRLIQRIIELETYRLLAQLSIPLAKRLSPALNQMDQQLAEMLAKVPEMDTDDGERTMLKNLSVLSARLESYRAETNYRFSATRAYHALVITRLQNVQERPVDGFMTTSEFMTRRLTPGMRTCESVQNWMEDLSRRIERAGDMLRTRVNLTLQEQNKSLLAAMNRRSRLQFRMQETVEGLSVAAISYYLVGLLGYFLGGLPLKALGLEKTLVMALLVPLVLGAVWWMTQRIKHRLIKEPAPGEG